MRMTPVEHLPTAPDDETPVLPFDAAETEATLPSPMPLLATGSRDLPETNAQLEGIREVPEPLPPQGRHPRLPSDARRMRQEQAAATLESQLPIHNVQLSSQPYPRWTLEERHHNVLLPGFGTVDVERIEPRLEVPPGAMCCCCGLAHLTCEDAAGNDGVCQRTWARIVVVIAALLDRLALCFVPSGSTLDRQLNPRDALARMHKRLTVLAIMSALVAVACLMFVASISAKCGCFLHHTW